MNNLGINSLKNTELVAFLEEHYNVACDNDDLTPDNLDTINTIVEMLERKGVA